MTFVYMFTHDLIISQGYAPRGRGIIPERIQDDKNDVSYIFEEHIYEVLTSYYPSGLNILEKKLKSWKIKLKKRRKY